MLLFKLDKNFRVNKFQILNRNREKGSLFLRSENMAYLLIKNWSYFIFLRI